MRPLGLFISYLENIVGKGEDISHFKHRIISCNVTRDYQ